MNKQAHQFYLYLVLILIFLVATFLVAPDPATLLQYHLSVTGYRLVISTVAIPLLIIWLAAFYGFAKLQKYADTIQRNKDGKAMAGLVRGVMYLVFQLPFISAANAVLEILADHYRRLLPTTVIIGHYMRLALPLVAFIFISNSARRLTEIVKQRPSQRAINILAVLFITIGAGFTFFVFNGLPDTAGALGPANVGSYDLPRWLVFFTLVVPYIYMWFIGLLAAYEVYLFQLKVPGIIYRQGWNLLAGGLGWIIFVSIVYEYFSALSNHLTRLHVTGLLLIVYAALLLLAIGYALVAIGAKQLQKIEEV